MTEDRPDSGYTPSEPIGNTSEPDSPVVDEPPPDMPAPAAGVPMAPSATCTYGGQAYSVGSRVCMAGTVHECYANGQWHPTTDKC